MPAELSIPTAVVRPRPSASWAWLLLVAVLIAALKLGDMMEVTPGPAAAAFATCVILSLLATARFDPHSLWESENASGSRAHQMP